MLLPDFPAAARHILQSAYDQYMKEVARPVGFSMNDFPGQYDFNWEDMKREALDLKQRELIEIVGRPVETMSTSLTLKLTAYGRQYCEDDLGFQAKIEE